MKFNFLYGNSIFGKKTDINKIKGVPDFGGTPYVFEWENWEYYEYYEYYEGWRKV